MNRFCRPVAPVQFVEEGGGPSSSAITCMVAASFRNTFRFLELSNSEEPLNKKSKQFE